jgi:hypothetical protein
MTARRLLEEPTPWLMTLGERAALTGILAQVRPRLAVEIGTAQGGSLRRIAEWSGHVHSFDVVEPAPDVAALPNVTLHTGDAHVLLPQFLADLARQGANVDFALVDGDHSAPGVARDMRDVLDSPAVGRTVILMHDSMNETVREGLQGVDYAAWDKVRLVLIDLVAGAMLAEGRFAGERWGGLGLVLVDAEHPRGPGEGVRDAMLGDVRRLVLGGQDGDVAALRAELARQRHALEIAEAEADRLRRRLAALEG